MDRFSYQWEHVRSRARRLASSRVASSIYVSLGIQALNVLTGVLLARALGVEGRGDLAAAVLWPTLISLFASIGLPDAVTYFSARRPAEAPKLFGSAAFLAICTTAGAAAIAFLAVLPWVLRDYAPETLSAARLMLLSMPLGAVALCAMAALNGLGDNKGFQVLRFLVVGLTAAGLVLVALSFGLTVERAVWVYVGANGLTLGAALARFVVVVRSGPASPEGAVTRRLVAFGLRSAASTAPQSVNERFDALIVSAFLTAGDLGLYVVGTTLAAGTSLVGFSIAYVAMPAVARLQPGSGRAFVAARYVLVAGLLGALVTLPLIVLAEPLLELFFGREFGEAAGVSRVLLAASFVVSLNRVLQACFKGVGRPGVAATAELAAMVALVALVPLGLWALDLIGAAVATLLGALTSTALMAVLGSRASGVSLRTAVRHATGAARPSTDAPAA